MSMAHLYLQEQDSTRAYIMYKRFLNLILETLPKHNGWSLKQMAPERSKYRKMAEVAVDRVAELRPIVKAQMDSLPDSEVWMTCMGSKCTSHSASIVSIRPLVLKRHHSPA